jgi:hypothetical protein
VGIHQAFWFGDTTRNVTVALVGTSATSVASGFGSVGIAVTLESHCEYAEMLYGYTFVSVPGLPIGVTLVGNRAVTTIGGTSGLGATTEIIEALYGEQISTYKGRLDFPRTWSHYYVLEIRWFSGVTGDTCMYDRYGNSLSLSQMTTTGDGTIVSQLTPGPLGETSQSLLTTINTVPAIATCGVGIDTDPEYNIRPLVSVYEGGPVREVKNDPPSGAATFTTRFAIPAEPGDRVYILSVDLGYYDVTTAVNIQVVIGKAANDGMTYILISPRGAPAYDWYLVACAGRSYPA